MTKTISLVSTVAHTVGVGVFGYSLYYDLVYVHAPPSLLAQNEIFRAASKWPGKWKYLTVWNIVLQLVYHILALVNDLVGSSELNRNRQTYLQKLRDVYFASWVFPTGMLVSTSFWGLYSLDRQLIFPVEMDAFYPCWLNHAAHTGPILFLTLDAYLCPKSYPTKPVGSVTNVLLSAIYAGWIMWINQLSNVWPYPFLAMLGTLERGIFMAAAGVVILLFYFLGEALNKWRWGSAGSPSAEKRKKKVK